MRFMILVKGNADTEAGVMPGDDLLDEMAAYHEELAKAGALLDGSGLKPTSRGWRVRYDGERRTVVDGPFVETKELIAGYTLIQVASREEALDWARRFPNPSLDRGRAEIEVRELFELEDFEDGPGLDRHRALEASQRDERHGD